MSVSSPVILLFLVVFGILVLAAAGVVLYLFLRK